LDDPGNKQRICGWDTGFPALTFKLIDLPSVQSRHIRQFAAYWQSKITAGAVPHRRDIDPADLKSLLPWLMIVEIEADPFRVLYRLVGTKVVQMNGVELTGRYLDELEDDGANFTQQGIAAYRQAWTQQQPVYGSYRWPTQSGAEYQVEFAIFPVLENKGRENKVHQTNTAGQCFALEDWGIDPTMTARRELPLPYLTPPSGKPRK
jgi:hypothetical protein